MDSKLELLKKESQKLKKTISEKEVEIENLKRESKKTKEIYETLLENLPIGIYYIDMKGTFIYGNKAAEEMVGKKREKLIGKRFDKLGLIRGKELLGALKMLVMNRLGKSTGPDEYTLYRDDGENVRIEIWTTPIEIDNEKFVMGMVRDISEQKKAEIEAEEKTKDLEKFQKLSVGREMKMVELKKRIADLEQRSKR